MRGTQFPWAKTSINTYIIIYFVSNKCIHIETKLVKCEKEIIQNYNNAEQSK